MKTPKFEIIAGTYEEFLLGFYFISKQTELVQSFAIHEHSSSIRCVTTSDHYVASGAADDKIIVYDLKQRKEHSMLNHHNATINCLQFTNNHSHLISGSSDGELSIVRVGSWQLEKTWAKAHKGSAILDIAVHKSGKLALTIGSDCSLRTWNLVKGRQAFIVNLNSKSKDAKSLEKIVWAEDGVRFILSGGKYTEIWSIETGGILKVIEHNEKICSCLWLSEDEIIVGYEDGQIAIIEINECSKNIQQAHNGRVKALAKYGKWIVSASSTGEIKVWNTKLVELSKYDTGCRITCLTVAVQSVKVKKENDEDILEKEEEQVKKKPIQKSSVVIEVEDDDNVDNKGKIKDTPRDHTVIKSKKIKIDRGIDLEDKHNKIKKKKKRIENIEESEDQLIEIEKPRKKKKNSAAEDSDNVEIKETVVLDNSEITEFVEDTISKKTNMDFTKKSTLKRKHKISRKNGNKKHK